MLKGCRRRYRGARGVQRFQERVRIGADIEMAPSSCAAEVEAMRAVWAGRLDGYAKAATPVTSAQV